MPYYSPQKERKVVVNDLGEDAESTANEINNSGGKAISVRGNVAEWETGERLVSAAIESFGDLHILINNAGMLRDAMSFSMNEKQFDEVIAVHLKGHFVCARAAAVLLEERSKIRQGISKKDYPYK